MHEHTTSPTLLRAVRDRDDGSAWRVFETRYGALILTYCRRLGLQLADAEDVRQDVLTSLSGALPGFEYDPRRGRFRTYVGRSVQNAVRRRLALAGRAPRPMDALILERLAEANVVESWEREWIDHHCRAALDELRETAAPQHVAIFEALLAGAKTVEIAQRQEVSEAQVRKVKQRIKARLSEIVSARIRCEEEPVE